MNLTAILLSTVFAAAVMQTSTAVETTYTGCVMRTEAGEWTFCEPDNCSLLRGQDVDQKLVGHQVTLRAAVQNATSTMPRTLVVSAVISIGAACSQTCSPRPPIHRGIGGKEHPGSEGGTPGVTSRPAPQ